MKNDLGYGEGRAPLLLQNIEANATVAVNIGMKDLCPECNLNGKKNFFFKSQQTVIKEEKKRLSEQKY